MTTSTITSKGQTTIPKHIREQLSLEPQQLISYEAKEGYVIMRPVNTSLDHFAGILKSDIPAASKKRRARSSGTSSWQAIRDSKMSRAIYVCDANIVIRLLRWDNPKLSPSSKEIFQKDTRQLKLF